MPAAIKASSAPHSGNALAAESSQRAKAYQEFTQQILQGGIRAGQFVSQRQLMALLDMPLAAVREMIPRLEAAGLVRTVPQRGLQVAPVDLHLIRNAFQVRSMVEREAISHFVHSASDRELAQIAEQHHAILQRARAAQKNGTPDPQLLSDAQSLDWGLHDRMVDALGNDIISELYRVNTLRVRLIRLEHSVITPARLIPAMQEHLDFIAALQQRDSTAAVELLQAHIRSARDRVLHASLDQIHQEWAAEPTTTPPNP
ncbi:GntR family transcriptional regulator [Curvibacter sp. CHRR-16]|uniref:GntR family transcriptional regulator n=1 Tax=Curvibacter sp. CHRR-16 TaxID=2835872 RepID=UPI001BDADC14|nr:GntR family transcriptional regulator [Curvibacter sp. CHRR-16]MBT0568938.1 GntR family transcriptional regulator [Curvibacter sp. CHRR-16]